MRPQPAVLALAAQREPLLDPEPVLLVDDDEPEVREGHLRLEQRMRSHRDRGLSIGDAGRRPGALAASEPAREPDHRDPERIEPAAKARVVLLPEQLRGRHQGDLAFVGDRHHRGDRRDHRLPGPDVALHEAMHRMGSGEIGPDLPCHPALGRGQIERQRVDEAPRERIAAVQRRGRQGVEPAPQHAQREMVREQLFERQAPPAGMPGVQRRLDARPRRRPVDRLQGMVEGDETMAHDDRFGQQLGDVGIALEPGEGLIDQAAQRRLPQARHRRIDRCQAIGGRSLCVAVKQPVLRMHHLDAARRRADLPVARDAPALTELPPLILAEVEQPHRHRPGAVVDGDHEGAAAPETDLRALNPAARERSAAGAQVFDCVDSGTVLISQGKMEQQIEHRLDPERCELRRDPRSHAAKLRHRRRIEWRRCDGLSRAGGSGCRAGPHVSPAPGCERGSDGIGRAVARHPWNCARGQHRATFEASKRT